MQTMAPIQNPVTPDASQPSNAAGMTGAAGATPMTTPEPPPPMPDAGASLDSAIPMMDAHADDDDAGPPPSPIAPPTPAELKCADGYWQLAPSLLIARKVDYVADRLALPLPNTMSNQETPTLLSSAGTACKGADDRAACESALALPTDFGRHLITTSGDDVKLWSAFQGRALLGVIDTEAEAIWWLEATTPYAAPCDAKVTKEDFGYLIDGIGFNNHCTLGAQGPTPTLPEPDQGTVAVTSDGVVTIIVPPSNTQLGGCMFAGPGMPVPGFPGNAF